MLDSVVRSHMEQARESRRLAIVRNDGFFMRRSCISCSSSSLRREC
jgi:hypothetical protein